MVSTSFGSFFQLVAGALVGFGVSINLEKHGVSMFIAETRTKHIFYLCVFVAVWVLLTTGLIALTEAVGQ